MIAVIVNEKAGDGPDDTSRTDALRDALAEGGVDATVFRPKGDETLQQTAERALAEGAKTLVAAGGDGTIAAVAGVAQRAGVPMGVLPEGTFNYFARAHGIPEDRAEAIATLARGNRREVRLGRINDRVFLNNASLGLYPHILKTREDVYRRFGRSRAAAYWSVLKTLVRQPRRLRLTITLDGRRITRRTPLAFVANSAYQLDEFDLPGADAVRAGRFALFMSPDSPRSHLLRAAVRMARSASVTGEDFTVDTAARIEIVPRQERILVACDGEKTFMTAPLVITHDDTPLSLIAPPPAG